MRFAAFFATIAVLLGVGIAPVPASSARPNPARALCAAGAGVTLGTVSDPAIDELSGLVASRAHPGTLWAHNDSGDVPRIFALRTNGTVLGTVNIGGVVAVDWEDIALGAGPDGGDHLFLGDIGDNLANRAEIAVIRIPEPDPPQGDFAVPGQRITLRYPDGAHDAEALLVDSRTGDLVIVTKTTDRPAGVYRASGAARAPSGSTVTLERVGDLGAPPAVGAVQRLAQLTLGSLATAVTAGDANASRDVAAVRTYGGISMYRWPKTVPLAQALLLAPCSAPSPTDLRFPQGEALALTPDGRAYLTASEGVGTPIVRFRAGH